MVAFDLDDTLAESKAPLSDAMARTLAELLAVRPVCIISGGRYAQFRSQVLANLMYDWMFRGTPDYGHGSAIAIVLMILVTPIMVWNIYNARKEVR